jgi:hypothetical protein
VTSPGSSRIVESPVDAILPRYVDYLRFRRYADDTIQRCLACMRHFTRWLDKRLTLADIDDALVVEFVDVHFPDCRCPRPCMRRVNTVRAALRHLLSVLKEEPRRTWSCHGRVLRTAGCRCVHEPGSRESRVRRPAISPLCPHSDDAGEVEARFGNQFVKTVSWFSCTYGIRGRHTHCWLRWAHWRCRPGDKPPESSCRANLRGHSRCELTERVGEFVGTTRASPARA